MQKLVRLIIHVYKQTVCRVSKRFFRYAARRRGIHRGLPNHLMELNNRAKAISPSQLPTADQAVQMYESSGGRLSNPAHFGSDRLHGERWEIKDQAFRQRYPSFSSICHSVLNGGSLPFKQALLFMIDVHVTTRLSV